jgi:hypothetical protein
LDAKDARNQIFLNVLVVSEVIIQLLTAITLPGVTLAPKIASNALLKIIAQDVIQVMFSQLIKRNAF